MKVIYIAGGLGNQMFQYAFYKQLQILYGRDVNLNLSYFNEIKKGYENNDFYGYELDKIFKLNSQSKESLLFNISPNKNFILKKIFFRILRNLKYFIYFENRMISIIENLDNINKSSFRYFLGDWQSEKYFAGVKEEIRKIFTFPNIKDKKNLKLLETMRKNISVSIHVRRGDYVGNVEQGELAPLKYYQNAIEYIKQKTKQPIFFIFSNDIDWCKKNLKIENGYYIDWNKGEESYRDMQLMSLCNHNIITNSTFSWWGAWLNNNPQKIVIAPEKWFNDCSNKDYSDIVPEAWIKIKNY